MKDVETCVSQRTHQVLAAGVHKTKMYNMLQGTNYNTELQETDKRVDVPNITATQ